MTQSNLQHGARAHTRLARSHLGLLAALLALASGAACALDPAKAFHHYVKDAWSIEHGLPQISVHAIEQDADGYLWVGTQAGLARFDGVRFTAWQPQTLPELPGMLVQDLLLDHAGRLWIGTYKGLASYRDGAFASVAAADAVRWPALDILALAETLDGVVLAATPDGVFRAVDGILQPLPEAREPASALLVRGRELWIGGRGGVRRLRPGGGDWLPLPAVQRNAVVTRLVAGQGGLYAGTSAGLLRLEGDAWQPVEAHPSLVRSPVDMLYQDRDGNLWVGLADGLARLRDGALAEFVPNDSPGAHPALHAAAEDHEGNLWLGSRWEGLARLWNGWTRRYAAVEGLHDPIIWSLARDPDGTLWVGTNDGLSRFDGQRFTLVVPGTALPHPHAYTLLPERDQLWIGTRRGLARLVDGRLEQPAAFAPLAATQVNGIVRDRAGTLWLATLAGLYRYRDGRLEPFDPQGALAGSGVRLVYETREQQLLVASHNGLFRREGERLAPVGIGSGLPTGLDVTAVTQLRDGRLVIGTLSEQVFVSDGQHWRGYGAAEGMPVNSPFFIAEDGLGLLWVTGIRGVGRVPLEDFARLDRGEIAQLRGEMLMNERGDRRAGQKGYCCNGAGNAKGFLEQGVLWLPSRGGVVAMDTAAIVKNSVAPRVLVERVRHSGGWQPAAAIAGATLPADARDLAFDFTVLSFQDPYSTRLRYRLAGYDADWHELEDTGRRSANYTNLPPGQYRFEVEGANNADVWSAASAGLPFVVQARLHETRWFALAMVLLGLLLVYGAFRWQTRALHRKGAALAAQVRERTAELQQANRQLREASHTDALTGLRNRRYLADQLPTDLAFYDREQQSGKALAPVSAGSNGAAGPAAGPASMVMVFALVDIDRFKSVNDQHGHAVGDALLQQFARLLAAQVRTGDYLVRWGGEEFLLVFRPMAAHQLALLGERICGAVRAQRFDVGLPEPLHMTCSVGFAEYPLFRDARGSYDWQQMVELADQALYWIKRHGRDGWGAFRPTARTDTGTLLTALQREGPAALLKDGRLELVSSRA